MVHKILVSLLSVVVAGWLFPSPTDAEEKRLDNDRPNIIVIYSDDHACHAVGAYGSVINQTPNIDRLARDGMLFQNSFVCNSICGPARAALLTGLHSHANGQTGNRAKFRDDLPTFAKSLQRGGYQTAMIGKWHLSTKPNGFSHWEIKKGGYYNSPFETPDGVQPTTGHVTDVITQRSIDWMREQATAQQPFMIWVSHSAVHRTWAPAGRHLARYAKETIPEPPTLFEDYSGKNPGASTAQMRISRDLFPAYDLKLPVSGDGILDRAAENQLKQMTAQQRQTWDQAFGPRNETYAQQAPVGEARTRWNYQRYIKNYLRCVDGIDESLGTIRKFLADNQLAENTIVIYTSDQGFYLGDFGWYDKRWMYEPSLKTPLVVYWPGVTPAGSVSQQLVQNIDIAPSLIELAGCPAVDGMHGQSLTQLLRGQSPTDWRTSIYYHYQMREPEGRTSHLVARHYGIRTDRHKLIYFYDHDFWELYDLVNDPLERVNQADNPEFANVRRQLKQHLGELRKRYGDSTGPAVPGSQP